MHEEEFGLHQTLDCYNCNEKLSDDFDAIFNFINKLPERIGMQRISPPMVVRYAGGSPKDPGGITGFVLIAESHISIHTFPKFGFITMDVYSCKPFNTTLVKKLVSDKFSTSDIEENVIKRGLNFRKLAMVKNMPQIDR
ncbi:MAG: S-adenosylmethionine decarboxylase [Candidatus Aenigmatarchaeota archaeon]